MNKKIIILKSAFICFVVSALIFLGTNYLAKGLILKSFIEMKTLLETIVWVFIFIIFCIIAGSGFVWGIARMLLMESIIKNEPELRKRLIMWKIFPNVIEFEKFLKEEKPYGESKLFIRTAGKIGIAAVLIYLACILGFVILYFISKR